ncbi:MAG: AAA family ATPase [Actinomycetota bacterium]|nr:AAA family ATPase [Actinomycetota bacterium]
MSDRDVITHFGTARYKSILKKREVEVRPLTVFAGANSSGKSSIMQPLLLLKQTLEAPYDPGALLLDGSDVTFTAAEQLLASKNGEREKSFSVFITIASDKDEASIAVTYGPRGRRTLDVIRQRADLSYGRVELRQGQSGTGFPSFPLPADVARMMDFMESNQLGPPREIGWEVRRDRCFLEVPIKFGSRAEAVFSGLTTNRFQRLLTEIIHVPALRGNPERSYPVTAVETSFPGTFEAYVASVIAQWQDSKAEELRRLESDLRALRLAPSVRAVPVNDTQVELRVGRLPVKRAHRRSDMVNIADVGFGVSQTLPLLVALQVARAGQMVYVEQPEIHLHPKAQYNLGKILGSAVGRRVRIVVETHSSLLLLGIQAAVARGDVTPQDVGLSWFSRDETGSTVVDSAHMNAAGSFGDWPEDFSDVVIEAQGEYLNAAALARDRIRLA